MKTEKAGISKFNWGDRVRIVKNIPNTEDLIGTVGVLEMTNSEYHPGFGTVIPESDNTTGSAMCVAVDWDDHEWFADKYLELVTDQN